MVTQRWLMVTIPLQALLILNQLLTGFSRDELPRGWFRHIHISTGVLLVSLVVFHIMLNWDWI